MVFQVEQHCNSLHKQNPSESARSRSTSTGGSSVSSPDEGNLICTYQLSSSLSELPHYEYPTQIFVRNTFIDTPIVRPLSLDEFIQERRIHSCPAGTAGNPDIDDHEEARAQKSHSRRATTSSASLLTVAANDAASAAARTVTSFHNWWNVVHSSAPVAESSSALDQDVGYQKPSDCVGRASQVICLANALKEPEVGSHEMPTAGSAGHRWGTCKPCAFLHKRGCENGVQCDFCHLCNAGEKKRRQKDKIAMLKEMRGVASFIK